MNPQEKAEYLVRKYLVDINDIAEDSISHRQAHKCALICVNEIIESNPKYPTKEGYDNYGIIYWEEVKQEIELL